MSTLVRYLDEIRAELPPLNIAELNLEEEVLLHYHAVRELQNTVLDDEELPLNQRSAVANSVTATLTKLVELQKEIFTSERIKRLESAILRAMRDQPDAVKEHFMNEYTRIVDATAR